MSKEAKSAALVAACFAVLALVALYFVNDTKTQNRRANKITVKHRARTQMKRNDTRKIQVKRNNVKRVIRVKRSDRRG